MQVLEPGTIFKQETVTIPLKLYIRIPKDLRGWLVPPPDVAELRLTVMLLCCLVVGTAHKFCTYVIHGIVRRDGNYSKYHLCHCYCKTQWNPVTAQACEMRWDD